MKIKINKYILKNNKINNNSILVLSDIHSNIKALDKIINYIKTIKLDYIFIPGDIVDTLNKKNEKEFLNKIIELSKYAKTYITIGNHDLYLKENNKINPLNIDEFKKTNYYKTLSSNKSIVFMIDEYNNYIDNNISISSITLPNDYYFNKESKKIFNDYMNDLNKRYDSNNKLFNITLIHSPNRLINKKKIINSKILNNSNLILCGHNHGGLTPTWIQDIFKNHIGLFGPFNTLLQKNAYGIYSNDNKNLLISNGVTKISDMAGLKLLHKPINNVLIPEVDLIYLEKDTTNSFKLIDRSKYE